MDLRIPAAAVILLLAGSAAAAAIRVDVPASVRQGETIRVGVGNMAPSGDGLSARLGERQIPLFRQPDSSWLGLMPVPVDFPPGTHALQVLDAAGRPVASPSLEVVDARFPRQNIRVSGQMSALRPLAGEMEAIRELQATVSGERYWKEPFLRPTPDCMNSVFGVLRLHNGEFTGNYHRGVDLRSPSGRPVRAVTDGIVRIARMYRLHGGTVGIDHGQGVVSIYIHLSKIQVKTGSRVRAGQAVGAVGATGFATGPHLHWGLYVNGLPVNPGQWLPGTPRCQ